MNEAGRQHMQQQIDELQDFLASPEADRFPGIRVEARDKLARLQADLAQWEESA